jgi:hypothetical protein
MAIKALLLALLFVPSLAFAGTNLKQKDDGTAVWQDTLGNEYPVRDIHLTTRIADVSTAATAYVVSPATNVKVTSIRAVIFAAVTVADSLIRASVVNSSGTFVRALLPLTAAVVAGSGAGTVITLSPTSANFLEAGQSVAIHTDGGSTTTSETIITVTLSPRS